MVNTIGTILSTEGKNCDNFTQNFRIRKYLPKRSLSFDVIIPPEQRRRFSFKAFVDEFRRRVCLRII